MRLFLISATTVAIMALTAFCAKAQQDSTPAKLLTLEECRTLAREAIDDSHNVSLVRQGAEIRNSILKKTILPKISAGAIRHTRRIGLIWER